MRILEIYIFLIFIFFTQKLVGEEKKSSMILPNKLDILVESSFKNVKDNHSKSFLGEISVEPDVKFTFGEKLYSDIRARLNISKGYVDYYETDHYSPKNKIYLDTAKLTWIPKHFALLTIGAIKETDYDSPIFLKDSTFLGLGQEFMFGHNDFFLTFKAHQAVISAEKQRSNVNMGDSKYPKFFYEGIKVEYENIYGAKFFGDIRHFLFKDLSTENAYDSRTLGNQIGGVDKYSATFKNEFKGFDISAGALYNFHDNFLKLRLGYSFNDISQNHQDKRQYVQFVIKHSLNNNYSCSLSLMHYRIEAESVPAVFSLKSLGFNNRNGYNAEIKLIKNELLTFGVDTTYSDKIDNNPFQGKFFYLNFWVGTVYDIF